METTILPEAGQLRIWKSFDFKMSMQANSTFDVLFSKNKVLFSVDCFAQFFFTQPLLFFLHVNFFTLLSSWCTFPVFPCHMAGLSRCSGLVHEMEIMESIPYYSHGSSHRLTAVMKIMAVIESLACCCCDCW